MEHSKLCSSTSDIVTQMFLNTVIRHPRCATVTSHPVVTSSSMDSLTVRSDTCVHVHRVIASKPTDSKLGLEADAQRWVTAGVSATMLVPHSE